MHSVFKVLCLLLMVLVSNHALSKDLSIYMLEDGERVWVFLVNQGSADVEIYGNFEAGGKLNSSPLKISLVKENNEYFIQGVIDGVSSRREVVIPRAHSYGRGFMKSDICLYFQVPTDVYDVVARYDDVAHNHYVSFRLSGVHLNCSSIKGL